MHLLDRTLDMLPPFLCVLCERTPERGGSDPQKVVDTLVDIEVDYAHHLEGRKYVCESCVREMATLVGVTSDIQKELDELQQLNVFLENQLASNKNLINAVLDLVPRPTPEPVEVDPADAVKRPDFKGRLVVVDDQGNRPTYPEGLA